MPRAKRPGAHRDHRNNCQICRPAEKTGRAQPAVTSACGIRLCEDHAMRLCLIVASNHHDPRSGRLRRTDAVSQT